MGHGPNFDGFANILDDDDDGFIRGRTQLMWLMEWRELRWANFSPTLIKFDADVDDDDVDVDDVDDSIGTWEVTWSRW